MTEFALDGLGYVALAVRILDQDKAAGLNMPHFAIARLVLHSAIQPHREHPLRHRMVTDFVHGRGNASKADALRRIMGRKLERRGVGENRPPGRWDIDLTEMGLAIRRRVDA